MVGGENRSCKSDVPRRSGGVRVDVGRGPGGVPSQVQGPERNRTWDGTEMGRDRFRGRQTNSKGIDEDLRLRRVERRVSGSYSRRRGEGGGWGRSPDFPIFTHRESGRRGDPTLDAPGEGWGKGRTSVTPRLPLPPDITKNPETSSQT